MEDLFQAIAEVINSADATGCSDDLTVISQKALDDLKKIYLQMTSKQTGGT